MTVVTLEDFIKPVHVESVKRIVGIRSDDLQVFTYGTRSLKSVIRIGKLKT